MPLLLWLVVALLVPHMAAAQDATGPFFGVWQNVDPNDDALVRLQIFTGPNGPRVDLWGRCDNCAFGPQPVTTERDASGRVSWMTATWPRGLHDRVTGTTQVRFALEGGRVRADFRTTPVSAAPSEFTEWFERQGRAAAIGLGYEDPRPLKRVDPQYTRDALAARIQGTVWLDGTVEIDGTVSDMVVIRSLDDKLGLDKAAMDALRQWRFAPGSRDGKPIRTRVSLEFAFSMTGPQ